MAALIKRKNLNEDTSWDVPKQRACLLCRVAFESTWSGERVCQHCKRTNAWRTG